LYPSESQVVVVGQSVLFQCRTTAGIPNPSVTWTRTDGRPLSSRVQVLDGGVLRSATAHFSANSIVVLNNTTILQDG
jgi:hypothetical protein